MRIYYWLVTNTNPKLNPNRNPTSNPNPCYRKLLVSLICTLPTTHPQIRTPTIRFLYSAQSRTLLVHVTI